MPDLQPPDLSSPAPRPPGPAAARPRPDAAEVLEANAAAMLGSARRVSLCEDDAKDAVQAAAERYLKHRERVDPETATGWLVTVARNEALRVRERRVRTGVIDDDDRRLVHAGDGPEDVAAREEELALAREALGRLKPQERLALWMQAEGRSYDEIAQELSWTRTKVNRSITEGRAHLRRTLAGIATGEGCAAAGPRIDRLASGHASADDLHELRPHLRRCASCRGRLRRARGARWGVLPPVLLAWLPWAGRGGGPSSRGRVIEAVAERLALVLPATSGVVTETGLAVTTGLAVVALGAGVATGGSADDEPVREPTRRAARVASAPATAASRATPSPVAAAGTTLVRSGRTLVAAGAASAAAAARAREAAAERERERARARKARERRAAAARRRRAAVRAAAARAAAAAAGAGSSATAAGSAAGGSSTGGSATGSGATAAPSGGGSSGPGSSGATRSGGGGAAADEFGFE